MRIEKPVDHTSLVKLSVRFMLLAGSLYVAYNWLPAAWVAKPLQRHTAGMTAFLLGLMGLEVSVNGVLVSAQGFTVKIVAECTAVFVGILFFSFVVAYPTSFKHKAIGLVSGLSFLFAANLLRVLAVFLTGMHNTRLFEYAHVYIGQIVMILLVLLTAMIWLRSAGNVELRDRPLGFLIRFVGFSSLPFVIWLYLDQGFVYANLFGVKTVLGLFGYDAQIPDRLNLYPHTFNTFHLIAYMALVLATKSIDRAKKLRSLVVGLAILCVAHFLFRLHYALFVDLHLKSAMRPFIALIIINQWVLPFGLWLYMVRHELFRQKSRFICPICGEKKKGLAAHIKARHGEVALHKLQNRSPEMPIAENRVKQKLFVQKSEWSIRWP